MSTPLTDDELLARLRDVLKSKNASLRDISKALDVPYRSVQNYLGGETRMPAVFLLNLCRFIGLEPEYLYHGDFKPRWHDLYDAVATALKQLDFLPDGEIDGESGIVSFQARLSIITKVTAIVSESYDRYRHDWLKKRDGGDHGRRYVPSKQ